jgi:putative FmdB family regulatory protein
MPIFEYQCKKCDSEFEFFLSRSEKAPTDCENCGAQSSLEKMISLSGFQLKGGGWYADLYSSTPKKEASDSTASESSASADVKTTPEKKVEGGKSEKSKKSKTKKANAA